MNSAILTLYDSFKAEDNLSNLIGREEGLYLEFKQKQNDQTGELGDNDRRGFSDALSAFANADGGVLILGIETARINGTDRATSLKPFRDHEQFRSRLADSILEATQPVVDGVRLGSIASAGGGGFVKCLIPSSDKFPHRAMRSREYLRRTSTGKRKMEHYEIADAFGRRQRPVLSLWVQLRSRPQSELLDINFSFENEGRALARHAGMLCAFENAKVVQTSGSGLSDVSSLNDGRPCLQFYDNLSVIHPSKIMRSLGRAALAPANVGDLIRFTVSWYAEDMETREATVGISPDQPWRKVQ